MISLGNIYILDIFQPIFFFSQVVSLILKYLNSLVIVFWLFLIYYNILL